MEQLEIPIFRKTYELYRSYYEIRLNISRLDRYTIWQRGENIILDLLEKIMEASELSRQEKLPILRFASVRLNFLRVFVRLAKDVKSIDVEKYITLQEAIDEIGRMLGGWIKSAKER